MDFLEGIRYLFNEQEDPETLMNMQMQLAEKLRIIETLKREIEITDLGIVLYKMQAYKFNRIYNGIKQRNEYNAALYSNLKEILGQSELLKFYLDRIELEKIRKYDEIPMLELNKFCKQQTETYQKLAERMGKRDIVKQFRAVHENHSKVLEMREKLKETQRQKRMQLNIKIEAAIQARNSAIVDIVKKAKKLAELQLQHKKIELSNKAQMETATAPSTKLVEPLQEPQVAVKAPLLNEQTLDLPPKPPQQTVKLPHELFESAFNEKFDFEVFNLKLAHPTTNLPASRQKEHPCSILRKSKQNDTKIKKHVTIISPSPSLSTIDSRESFLTFQPPTPMNAEVENEMIKTSNLEVAVNQAASMPDRANQTTKQGFSDSNGKPQSNKETAEHDVELRNSLNSTFTIEPLLVTNAAENSSPLKAQVSEAKQSLNSVSDSENVTQASNVQSSDEPFFPKSLFEFSGFGLDSGHPKNDHSTKSVKNSDFESSETLRFRRPSNDDFLNEFDSNRCHSKFDYNFL